jgi:flagellar biosynthesis/type III secretory pathway chaperone
MAHLDSQYLRAALEREVEYAAALLDVLHREYRALTHRDSADLESIIDEKKQSVARLDEAGRVRERVLRAAGLVVTPDIKHRSVAELAGLWEKLEGIARDLRFQNETNGRVIDIRYRHCEYALGILEGKELETEVYHPKAKAKQCYQFHSRCLAKA